MKIIVGSENPVKISAVNEAISEYMGIEADVHGMAITSGVPPQPIGLDKTIYGAQHRAISAYAPDYYFSIGLESGLIFLDATKRYLDFCACAVYDGKEFYFGLSPGFELPQKISEIIEKEGVEIDVAVHRTGLSKNSRIGYSEGIIGILSEGKITRKDYTKQAVLMSLLHLPKK